MLEVIIRGEPKEVAALVLETQGQRVRDVITNPLETVQKAVQQSAVVAQGF